MQTLYNKLKNYFKRAPLFLIFLPLFFIYSGYNELFGFLPLKFVFSNLAIILVCVFICFLISFKLLSNFEKASLFTFTISSFCLVFGYLHDSLKKLLPDSFFIKFTFLIPAIFVFFLIVFIILKKRKKAFTESYLFLNLLFVILLLSEIPNSIKRYQLDTSVNNLIDFRFNVYNEYKSTTFIPDSLKPDIYFLVFDAMGSSKSLLEGIGKNNDRLDSFFRQQDFFVAKNSIANYNWTIHSLSTTLNMDYLPPWISPVMNDPKAFFWGSSSILNNSLFAILKKEGYRINSYQQISFDNKDWPGDSYFLYLKENHFYFKTLPGRIFRDVFWNYLRIDASFITKFQMDIIRRRIKQKQNYFDTTRALIKRTCAFSDKPKFVYGHFMLPHEPYVFDSIGNLKTPAQTINQTQEEQEDNYFNQVLFADKVIKELVDYIRENNKRQTVIIVEGDHGYRTAVGNEKGYTFQNLNAMYFPDRDYELLYDSLSPVNTFRIVLNKYFHAKIPLLKDSSILVTKKTETLNKKAINK